MKHLFVINPKAKQIKGHVATFVKNINDFFLSYPWIKYDIHLTRWRRDAEGFIQRYVSDSQEMVKIYALGGTGTLFEVVNGVIGLPNVQITAQPLGALNSFIRSFGEDKLEQFCSLRNLFFSKIITIDALRCGKKYCISKSFIGILAKSSQVYDAFSGIIPLSVSKCLLLSGLYEVMSKTIHSQYYTIEIDGNSYSGEYISIMVANEPYCGPGMTPAQGACPTDGLLDVYLVKAASRFTILRMIYDYEYGHHEKWPNNIFHLRGKSVSISSDEYVPINMDGELFYDKSIQYDIIPQAIDFACPETIGHV